MDEKWQRVADVFNAALDRDPGDRAAFLDEVCASDAGLRAEVVSLLAAHERSGGFLAGQASAPSNLASDPSEDRPDSLDLRPGQVFGAYMIERELGRGGMGLVYLAEDVRLGRRVALKVLSPAIAAAPTMRARLGREARAAASLSDPAIATVFSFEEIDGRACLVTEFVDGDTLRSELSRGPLPLDVVLDTGIRVARGLACAHAAGIVHRDLKPENVVRSPGGAVKILDFGIAHVAAPSGSAARRLTQDGSVVGTPGYMSPEQLSGAVIDARSDIFALGVLLYELAAGVHPLEARPQGSAAGRVLAAEPPALSSIRPGLAPGLDDVVRRCLRPDPAERFASALDVARALEDIRDAKPGPDLRRERTPAPASTGWRSALRWWRVHQLARMAVVAALVYGVWRVHAALRNDWTLAIFLAYVVVGAVNGTLRAHLLFISAVTPADQDDEVRRARPMIALTDHLVTALLLVAASAIAAVQLLLPSILAAVAVGWAVTALVVEPAIYRAAFRR